MDKVLAMEQGDTGKVLERTVHQIIVISSLADTGVGMKTRDDRILVSLSECL